MMEFEEATSLRNPPLTTEQCKTIFSSLVVIKGFNDVLLDDLGNRISDWDEDNTLLGDIFLKLGDYLKIYNSYCVNYAFALKTLSVCDKNPGFQELLQSCEAKVNHQPFVFFLVTPIQRLPRYLMLLKRLLEETSPQHPDYSNLQKASQRLAQITERVNEDLRSATEMNRIYRLQEKLDCEFQLIAPARYLVREQRKLRNVLPNGKGGVKTEPCDVFLFNDLIILVAAPKLLNADLSATSAPRLKLRSHCEFEHAVVLKGLDSDTLTVTHTSQKSITVKFPTPEMRDEWFQAISQHIQTTKEKAAAFIKEATRSASYQKKGTTQPETPR